MPLRAVVYTRQSQDRDGSGAAVERQAEDCLKLCADNGWNVIEQLSDNDISASTGKHRPGYDRLLDLVRAGAVDRIVCWHVDRLTRRVIDLEQVIELCERSGVRVATVTGELDLSTDVGRMLARILASVARGEVERKSSRQKRANLQRAQAGTAFWTRRPFGYDRDGDGKVTINRREATALRNAADRVLQGATLSAVIRELNAAGHVTTADKPWNVTSLRRALLNPRYAGQVVYRGENVARGQWPVILGADTQQQVAEMLRDPIRRVQQGTELKYLLSGLVRCGRCGGVMFAAPYAIKGRRIMIYACRPGKGHLTRRMDLVDEVVLGVVLGRLRRPDAAALLVPDVDLDGLRRQADDLRHRRDALAGMLGDGLMSATAVREQASRITGQLDEIERQISAAVTTTPATELIGATDLDAVWASLPMRTRRDVIELLATVTVMPSGKGARFSPDQIRIDWK